MNLRVGVISDTHGLLRPEAVEALRGSDYIIHADDVGKPEILDRLREIAPLTVVRGNVDREPWASSLLMTDMLDIGGSLIYVLHDLSTLDLLPESAGSSAVIYGHSHQPSIEWRNGVLFLNPGSAGPSRFHLPITVALLEVGNDGLKAWHVETIT